LSILVTIVHISDLHFGKSFVNTEDSFVYKTLGGTPVKGRFPHSYAVALMLRRKILEIVKFRERQGIPVAIVDTGDRTRSGRESQFRTADQFLKTLGADVRSIPGNHDCWKGKYPHPARYPIFVAVDLPRGSVHYYGLNSNESSRHWLLSAGQIREPQLVRLCRQLREGAGSAVQIVGLHHPVAVPPGMPDSLSLANREAIAGRLIDAGADLILAGHVHYFAHPAPRHFIASTACQLQVPPHCNDEHGFNVFDIHTNRVEFYRFRRGYDDNEFTVDRELTNS
jgi:3',5'-cyclic AMP phosphodiesterase CpdA